LADLAGLGPGPFPNPVCGHCDYPEHTLASPSEKNEVLLCGCATVGSWYLASFVGRSTFEGLALGKIL
jgi:hypothetical protein